MDRTLQHQVFRGIWVAICLVAGLAVLYWIFPLVYPFLIGWAIAYVLNGLVNLLQRRARLPRWLAVSLSLLLFLSVAAGLIALLVTNLTVAVGNLSTQIQNHLDEWINSVVQYIQSDFIQSIMGRLNTFYADNPQYQNTINNNLSTTAKQIADFGSALVGYVLGGIVKLLTSLPSKATVTIISLLAAFFISKDWYKLQTRIAGWFPQKVRRALGAVWIDLQKALFGYIRAQLILISITTLVITVGLGIIGIANPIGIGLLIGLCDLLPYLGVGSAMIPWMLVVLFQGNMHLGIGLAVLYGIVLVVRQLIEPKVLASSLDLEPLPLIIAIFVGLKLFGLGGLIIGPVALIILFAVSRAGVIKDLVHYIRTGKFLE